MRIIEALHLVPQGVHLLAAIGLDLRQGGAVIHPLALQEHRHQQLPGGEIVHGFLLPGGHGVEDLQVLGVVHLLVVEGDQVGDGLAGVPVVPIYEQLMEQIKSEIIQSVLKEGEALPSVRTLAGELRISALTVKKAYDKLEEEGFVTTVHGKGTYVTASDKQLASEARRIAVEEDFDKAIDRAVAIGMEKEEILEVVKLILDEK